MKLRDVLFGAVCSLIVMIVGGVMVHYLTKEPPSLPPQERLVYDIEEPVTFEAQATRFALLSVRIGNLGDLPAENVQVGIVFEDNTEIIDMGITLSTGPVGAYTMITSTEKVIGFQVPALTPDEVALVSLMLTEEPTQDPIVGVKSDNSTGKEGCLARPVQIDSAPSRKSTITVLIILIAYAAFSFNLYKLMMMLLRRFRRSVNNTSFLYIHKGLADKAKKMLSSDIESRGGDSYSLANYALCLALDRDFSEAEKTLDAAEFLVSSRRGPLASTKQEKAVILFNRSLLLLLQDKTSEGLNFMKKATELAPRAISEYCSYSVVVDDLRKKIEELKAFLLK